MKTIKLTQGKYALVDDADFDELNKYKWHAHKGKYTYYVKRNTPRDNAGKQKSIFMHRVIMGTPEGMDTDHVDGNGLNNQRTNLRICNRIENTRNQGKTSSNTSGFKGVSFHKSTKKWKAAIQVAGKYHFLGHHATKELAYEAYCNACVKYHGEFANVG